MTENPNKIFLDWIEKYDKNALALKELASILDSDPSEGDKDMTAETAMLRIYKLSDECKKLRKSDAYLMFLDIATVRTDGDKIKNLLPQRIYEGDHWRNSTGDFKIAKGDAFAKLKNIKDVLGENFEAMVVAQKFLREQERVASNIIGDLIQIKDGHMNDGPQVTCVNLKRAEEMSPSLVEEKGESPESKTNDPAKGKASYSSVASTKDKKAHVQKRWADASSSEDEDLIDAIKGFGMTSSSHDPTEIVLPGDFFECFPVTKNTIMNFVATHDWTIKEDSEIILRNQGLPSFKFNEDKSVSHSFVGEKDEDKRVAVQSILTAIASLSYTPEYLVGRGTEVALTYLCSLIAKESISKEDRDPQILKVAMKSGDGGKTVLQNRLYGLTQTGTSSMKLVFEAIDKMLHKLVQTMNLDLLEESTLRDIQNRAFTSTDGMMENSYRSTTMVVIETIEIPQTKGRKKGKPEFKEVRSKKIRKSIPDLTIGDKPFKTEEIARVNALRKNFNDRKSVIESRLGKVSKSDILDKPKICKEVVEAAYLKLQSLNSVLKDRTARIRVRATELSDGKKPTQGHWAVAKAEILATESEIPEVIWDGLGWKE